MGPSERMRVARKAIERARAMNPALSEEELERAAERAVRNAGRRRARPL